MAKELSAINRTSEPGIVYYPPPKEEGYRFVHVRPSVRSHYYVTAERNFMKLKLNMYRYNDVIAPQVWSGWPW